jgi:phospholipid/cholesterol/gamma-HCH transport system ATP-binding protein
MSSSPTQGIGTVHKSIIFEDVGIGFDGLPVLSGISFELKRGETKVILGIAGAGKSTILKLCLGLIRPDQ